MSNLISIGITLNTHVAKDPFTVLHIFIKNRSTDSSNPQGDTSYEVNHANCLRYAATDGPPSTEINPFLAWAENFAAGVSFAANSTYSAVIPLRPTRQVTREEIVLPVVNIHILPFDVPVASEDVTATWAFDYVLAFHFADSQYDFTCSSNVNGVTGIILDKDNRDYAGVCTDAPSPPAPAKPPMPSLLTAIDLVVYTHEGQQKNADTTLGVHIVNRIDASNSTDIAVAANLAPNTAFTSDTAATFRFAADALPLASSSIRLQDIVLPLVNIIIAPNGSNTWKFDYRITYWFSYSDQYVNQNFALRYASTASGIILNERFPKHTGAHTGDSFPSISPVAAQLTGGPVNHALPPKQIPIAFLQTKLVEFINSRQSLDPASPTPVLRKLRLHHTDPIGPANPASYYDLQAIDSDPPPPGTQLPPDYSIPVRWNSSPTDLGPLTASLGGYDLNDINSKTLTANVDITQLTPLVVDVDFEVDGGNEIEGGGSAKFSHFSITLYLTFAFDKIHNRVDLLSWVDDLEPATSNLVFTPTGSGSGLVTGTFIGQPVSLIALNLQDGINQLKDRVLHVALTAGLTDFGGTIRQSLRDRIYSKLATRDKLTQQNVRDQLNGFLNSWFLGGVINGFNGYQGAAPVNNATQVLTVVHNPPANTLDISYTGPQATFQFPAPAAWPPPDFTPGALANIDHIVVLTMENRSFDHMLGYLSLPPASGGMGRAEIDGLTGGEHNLLSDGTVCPSIPFLPGETVFAPDPPHSYAPVQKAINGGNMDGFAQSYADQHGTDAAPNIMKFHTGVNVPVYDALARDFAICQRWFAAHPGPTFCNRYHELTGRLNIDPYGFWELSNSSTLLPVFTKTIFDHLHDAGVSWKYFEDNYCFLRFFENHTFDTTNVSDFNDPGVGFANVAARGLLPSVTFIDPHFIELPPHGNCDGPPADIRQGQLLVQNVVQAVVTSPTWNKTMLIITYDEHGGFFDHVAPPPAAQIAPGLPQTFGVRVPAFIISPWVSGGMVFGNGGPAPLYFDHTSILKTIAKRFLSTNPPYLGARYAAANDLSSVIGPQLRPSQFLPFIPYTLVFGPSRMNLEVQGGSTSPGAILLQNTPAGTDAQKFAFEDAGAGHVYIRTFSGRLYLTVDTSNQTPGQPLGVKQDARYPAVGGPDPALQRWSCVPAQVSLIGQPMYRLVSAAFPSLVLQPLGAGTAAELGVVIGAPENPTLGYLDAQYMWVINSPLLSSGSHDAPPDNSGQHLDASTSALNFSPVDVTIRSPQQTVTLSATQGAQFILSSIALVSDTGAQKDFAIVPEPGSPPPGEIQVRNGQLVLTVWFIPTAAGNRTAAIQIGHNLSNNPLTISLSGTGVAAALPVLHTSVTSMSFSTKTPPPPPLILTNRGTGPLIISSITVQGTNFTVGTACVGTLAPGQSCTVPVSCKFQGVGGTEELVIVHNAAGRQTVIDLNATSKDGRHP